MARRSKKIIGNKSEEVEQQIDGEEKVVDASSEKENPSYHENVSVKNSDEDMKSHPKFAKFKRGEK